MSAGDVQAHMQARYAILRVLLEAGHGLVSVSSERVMLDRSKILSVGRPAIGNFLQKLNVYKVQSLPCPKKIVNRSSSLHRYALHLTLQLK